MAVDNDELEQQIRRFDEYVYMHGLEMLFSDTGMTESGKASASVANIIKELTHNE